MSNKSGRLIHHPGYDGSKFSTVEDEIEALRSQARSVLTFIPVNEWSAILAGTSTTDLSTYLAAAQTWQASFTYPPRLVFPAGQYSFSSFPNFALSDAQIVGDGEVVLRYTGTGNAVFVDGGSGGGGVYNMIMGPFSIHCPNTATDAFRVRAVHSSKFNDIRVRGAGASSAGFLLQWCVCTQFKNPQVSGNEGGWYSTAPAYGFLVDRRGSGSEFTSYCLIENPLIEGVSNTGIYFLHALGNAVLGGTSEGNTVYGVVFDTPSLENKCLAVDFEVNGTADALIAGLRNRLVECDTYAVVTVASSAIGAVVSGGAHSDIAINSGAAVTQINDLTYNRFNDSSAITDSATDTIKRGIIDGGTNTLVDAPAINAQTGNYVAVLTDATKTIEMNVAGANTLTVPPNSSVAFPIGTYLNFTQYGAGQTTLTPGSGVTIRSRNGLKTGGQYAIGTLYKRATNEWVAGGDLTV